MPVPRFQDTLDLRQAYMELGGTEKGNFASGDKDTKDQRRWTINTACATIARSVAGTAGTHVGHESDGRATYSFTKQTSLGSVRGGASRQLCPICVCARLVFQWIRLEAEGVVAKAAESRGQLTIVDADNILPAIMRDAMPDSPVFLGLAADVISHTRGDGSYPKVL